MTLIGRPDRDVQLVDLALAFEVLELPHPLLADGVDLHRLVGRTAQVVEDRRAPAEHHHRDDRRDHAPQQLERQVALDARANLAVVRACGTGCRSRSTATAHDRARRTRMTARMKKYSASTSLANVDACSGKIGMPNMVIS